MNITFKLLFNANNITYKLCIVKHSNAHLEQKLADLERRGDNRFELMRNFIFSANHEKNLTARGDFVEMRKFLETVGSNRRLVGGVLTIEFRKPWSYLASSSAEARAEGEGEARNGAISANLGDLLEKVRTFCQNSQHIK